MTDDPPGSQAADQVSTPGNRYGGQSFGSIISGAFGQAPGYSCDRGLLERVASEFESLAKEFDHDIDDAATIARTQPPGRDFVSGGNAEVFRRSGEALVESLRQRARYCRVQAAKFQVALGVYATVEDAYAAEVKRAGGSL
ncbi:PE family protein [Amycolatopsis sulphurea]|uniref:PE family protein n=1 Tax=Amycolatopsis sulphurea TaxID=76022 RepID=A0A2A9F851_9PSEU|nr:PE domain-containing protein [Amycolatopsis sulphurea]PFG47338.1 PE family protein [Amycolatopsis sulphurea]